MVDGDGNLLPAATANRPNLSDIGWPPAPPPDDDRQTILDEALAYAAINGRDAAIDWLLDYGAEVDGRPYLNITPLHFAVQFGRSSTVQLLLARGADPEIRDDIRGGTPLGWAAYQGRDEIARLLDPARSEAITDTGLAYRPGEPVRLRVMRRERRLTVSDGGAALAQARRPAGWRAIAERLERELDVNISGAGAVWLPVRPSSYAYSIIRFTPSSNGSPRRRSPSTKSCWSWPASERRRGQAGVVGTHRLPIRVQSRHGTSSTSNGCASANTSIAERMQKSCFGSTLRTPTFAPRRQLARLNEQPATRGEHKPRRECRVADIPGARL